MMIDLSLYFLMFLSICNLLYLGLKTVTQVSDYCVHILFINLIKKNKHRFIQKIDPFLFGNFMGYPQLYHWILSFFNHSQLAKIATYNGLIHSLIGVVFHLSFIVILLNNMPSDNNAYYICLYSTVLYLSSGLLHDSRNARNAGISPRSIGLLLGQLYTYLIILYYLNIPYVGYFIPLLVLLSFVTSQFTTQFILFMSMFLSILFRDLTSLYFFVIAFLIFCILFPQTSKNYLLFQWKHKKYFIKYGTKIFLIPSRSSIWGDFITGFWKKRKKDKLNLDSTLRYMFYNPVIVILTGVPIIVFIVFAFIYHDQRDIYADMTVTVLLKVNLAALLIFLATSFKYTRFLGEPERYIDFVVSSFSIMASLIFYDNPFIIITAAIMGLPRILIECYFFPYVSNIKAKRNHIERKSDYLGQLRNLLSSIESKITPIRLFSNNIEITKQLVNTRSKFFYGWIFVLSDKYDPYKLFKKHAAISDDMIIPLIKEYSITHFILDSNLYEGTLENNSEIDFINKSTFGPLQVYQVCSKT